MKHLKRLILVVTLVSLTSAAFADIWNGEKDPESAPSSLVLPTS